MAEGPEHTFLKSTSTDVLQGFSRLRLYLYHEADRKKFDMACLLERDWSRPLVGQVLWHHSKGIDKDVRTLLLDPHAEIKLYVARDHMKNRQQLSEVLEDFKRSGKTDLYRLKIIWIPSDFDADKEAQRILIQDLVQSRIVSDILMNVVFGNLEADHIRLFLTSSGIQGVNLALLDLIDRRSFELNFSGMSQALGISKGPIREKISILHGAGLVETPDGVIGIAYRTTPRGRLFLDLLGRLMWEMDVEHEISSEMIYILSKLDCQVVSKEEVWRNTEIFPQNKFIHLLKTIRIAREQWRLDLTTRIKLPNKSLKAKGEPAP
ncbi:MAG: hypothetical protein M1269_04870 [Chloroflexi bacterium]|nr:hypothetical protein [Chloroflexota bacterium]